MIRIADELRTLASLSPDAKLMTDGGQEFVFLPKLSIAVGQAVKTLDVLLCPSRHSGYSTRLFLAEPISERPTIGGKTANWSAHTIMARTWHSWSWDGVSADLPLLQMLLAHVAALR